MRYNHLRAIVELIGDDDGTIECEQAIMESIKGIVDSYFSQQAKGKIKKQTSPVC
jgi:hypothetical protein